MTQTTVLLVDSDLTGRNFLAQMLVKRNYSVHHASTGVEGIEVATRVDPDVVIVETNLPDLSAIEFKDRMGQTLRLATIPCVVLSGHSTPEEMQACISAGYAEYFVKSGMVMMTLVESIPRILMSRTSKPDKDQNGLVIAFLSAKGGTGTSSLCANIGMNIAQHVGHSNVAILDLVLPIGSIAKIVGYGGEINVATIADQSAEQITPDFVREHLVTPPNWLIHLLPGSPNPREADRLHIDRIPQIVASLKKAYNFLLIDLGRSLSKISLPLIKQADVIVLVLSADFSTLNLTKTVWDFFQDEGIDPQKMFPILNRAVGMEGLTKAEAEKILGLEIKLTVPYMMGNFTLANNQNMPISMKFPNDTVSMVLKEAAINISRQAIKVTSL